MIMGTEEDNDDCSLCDEGWCYLPEEPWRFRFSHPFTPHYQLRINLSKSTSDAILAQHKAEFEGKNGLSGFIWGSNGGTSFPEGQVATMFPLTPVIDGHCMWGATRHSVEPYTFLMGHHVWNHTTFTMGNDFPLTKLPVQYPTRQHTCGFIDLNKQLDNTPIYVVRNLGGTNSNFSLVDSGANAKPDHFWVPDRTPLKVTDPICVFGSPGGGESLSSAVDLASKVAVQLFTYNTKSASTGRIVGVSPSVICHDASTLGGFCGAPGVNLDTSGGMKFSFIHTGEHPKFGHPVTPVRHNHGLSVNDPEFKLAYTTFVVPLLRAGKAMLSPAQIAAIENYVPNAFA